MNKEEKRNPKTFKYQKEFDTLYDLIENVTRIDFMDVDLRNEVKQKLIKIWEKADPCLEIIQEGLGKKPRDIWDINQDLKEIGCEIMDDSDDLCVKIKSVWDEKPCYVEIDFEHRMVSLNKIIGPDKLKVVASISFNLILLIAELINLELYTDFFINEKTEE